jgi:F-type H+-transporting ATPase subunit alpha
MRRTVSEPLQTGVLVLDSLVPIGRGQRELVVGDRQTGKTSLCLDAILNQESEGVVCVFASVGQRASTLLGISFAVCSRTFSEFLGFVFASSFDRPSLQYFCPYASAAVSEFFMWAGQLSIFLTFDDLSKHAVCSREIYLLLKRPCGREAYPGEIFFVHSRLLERSSKLSFPFGGGSVTSFPVIETLAADVSSYISTNVISITDGQIFLSLELFLSNIRPSVDVGLSVTRIGSAAQWTGVKNISGSYKIEMAQYFELQSFAQFSSDLGEETQRTLKKGSLLVSLLKQFCGSPLRLYQELVLLSIRTSWFLRPTSRHPVLGRKLIQTLKIFPEWLFILCSVQFLPSSITV